MKRIFRKKKKSASEVGSLASGRSASGYDVSPNKKEFGKLHKASYDGDLTKLKTLLKKGDVNEFDKENRTPLHLACANGKIDSVRMLVNHPRCNLNLCDNDRRSALMKCVQCQFHNCLDILLRKGADLSLSDVNGNTALHLAVSIPSTELSYLLLDYSADIHCRNKDGSTPLHIASSVEGADDVIKTLLDDGAAIDAKDSSGKTPLMLAAGRGLLSIVQLLLDKDADPNLKDSKGWSADDHASMNGHHPTSHVIVEHAVSTKPIASPKSRGDSSAIANHRSRESVPGPAGARPSSAGDKRFSFLTPGGPAMETGEEDLSRLSDDEDDDEEHKGPLFDDDDDDSYSPPKDPAPAKPKVNVMQFLRDREKLKQGGGISPAGTSPDQQGPAHNGPDLIPKPHADVADESPRRSTMVDSGPSTPRKPPLPQVGASSARTPRNDDESPWDSSSEDDQTSSAAGAPRAADTKPQTFNKPHQGLMAELGLNDDDVANLYKDDDDVTTTSRSLSRAYDPGGATPRHQQAPAESDWDDDSDDVDDIINKEMEARNQPKGPAVASFFAGAAALKFDDEVTETDEESDPVERALAPSNSSNLVTSPPPPDHTAATEPPKASPRSLNADSASANGPTPYQDKTPAPDDYLMRDESPQHRKSDDYLTGGTPHDVRRELDDESSSSDISESESSWEVENKNRRQPGIEKIVTSASNYPYTNHRDDVMYDDDDDDVSEDELRQRTAGERQTLKTLAHEASLKKRERDQKKAAERKRQLEEKKAIELERDREEEELQRQLELAEKKAIEKREREAEERQRELEEKKEEERQRELEKKKAIERQRDLEEKKAQEKQRELERKKEEQKQRELEEKKAEERQREQEEKKAIERQRELEEKKAEDEKLLRESQDREKIRTALENALDSARSDEIASDSDISDDFDLSEAGPSNPDHEMGRNVVLDSIASKIPKMKKSRSGERRFSPVGQLDLSNLTGSETTEDELQQDHVIPTTLRSSQFSASLERSGEKGALERDTMKDKRKMEDVQERLKYTQRDNEHIRDQLDQVKEKTRRLELEREEQDAKIRKLTFELRVEREKLQTNSCELESLRDGHEQREDQLDVERTQRRKQEVTIRELKYELKNTEQALKTTEEDREELRVELMNERRQMALKDQLDKNNERAERETGSRQVEALNMLMEEKDKELVRTIADRNSLRETNRRLKGELEQWRTSDDDSYSLLTKLNAELNERVDELTHAKFENQEALQQAAMQFNMQIHQFKQANVALKDQIAKDRSEKEGALRDLEMMNEQQRALRRQFEDMEVRREREIDRCQQLEKDLKDLRQEKDQVTRRVHASEVSDNVKEREAMTLRTQLTHKEAEVTTLQRQMQERDVQRERREKELNDLRISNASLIGKTDALKIEISQLDSERLRLKTELDSFRISGTSNLSEQQEKFTNILSEHHRERIELEKHNAQLGQQVEHFKHEIERLSSEKTKKEEELAAAQQDRIEKHKALSFTEESMAQMSETQRQLHDDKKKMLDEVQALQKRVEDSTRAAESLQRELDYQRKSSQTSLDHVAALEEWKDENSSRLGQLEQKLKTIEAANLGLESELANTRAREECSRVQKTSLEETRHQLEEHISRIEHEKDDAQEKLKEANDKCRTLAAESDGHRQMWEEETKAKSRLNIELRKVENDKRDAELAVESYKRKLQRSRQEAKSHATKYGLQKKKIQKLEEELETCSRSARDEWRRAEQVERNYDGKLSRASDQHRDEKSRMEQKIVQLETKCFQLEERGRRAHDEKLEAERRLSELRNSADSTSSTSFDHERQQAADHERLHDEIRRLRGELESGGVGAGKVPRSAVNAEVSAKLDQVNSWLEEQSAKQENLERLRRENEKTRLEVAGRRIEELEREVGELRRRPRDQPQDDERVGRELQKSVRDNISLQEALHRTKQQLEENRAKLSHERRKNETLYANMIAGQISANVGSPYTPLSTFRGAAVGNPAFASTPMKTTSPELTKLRNKLDATLANRFHQSDLQQATDRSRANLMDELTPRPSSNEYMSFLPS